MAEDSTHPPISLTDTLVGVRTSRLELLRAIIQLVDVTLEECPGMSLPDFVGRLHGAREAMEAQQERTRKRCNNCGHDVLVPFGDDRLMHVLPSGRVSRRGCRAASYDRHMEEGRPEGWDPNLAKGLVAQ